MEVTYTQTQEDLAAFRRFHARHRNKWRVVNLFLNAFLALVWAAQLLLIASIAYADRALLAFGPRAWPLALEMHQHLLINFVLLTLFLAYLLWGQTLLLGRLAGKRIRAAHPQHLHMGPEGVTVTATQEQVTRPWKDIPDIGSDKDCIYLYLTKATALVVPRRAFLSLQDAQVFEAQARRFRDSPSSLETPSTDGETNSGVWPPRPVVAAAPMPPPSAMPFADLENAPGAIVLPYTTTKADLIRAQWFFLPRRPASWLGVFIPYTLAAAVWTVPRFPLPLALLWAVGIAVAGTLLTLAWATSKTLGQRFSQFPQGRPCRTIAAPATLCDITPEGRKIYPWQDITSIQMQAGDIYVLCKSIGGMVIPRTAFADARQAAAFAETLRGFWQQGKDAPRLSPAPVLAKK